jgi:hypothetical protein
MAQDVSRIDPSPEAAVGRLRTTTLSLPASIRKRLTIPTSGADQWSISGQLSADERAALARQSQQLDVALAPAGQRAAEKAIAALLIGFPATGGVGSIDDKIRVYLTAVAGYPVWAINEACGKFVRGEIDRPNHSFAPSPPELSIAVADILKPLRLFAWEIRKTLEASVQMTDEEREANRERVRSALPRLLGMGD